jgi:hypothetical protein
MATTLEPKANLERAITDKLDDADKNLIKQARKRFVQTSTNWSDIRKESVRDQKFFNGDHFDDAATRAGRAHGGAPQISINMLPNFVQQVENQIRQQNIGINVHATDETGSEETAKILQGLVRHIEHISNAKQAYLYAAGSHGALVPGFGFMKLETCYVEQNGEPTFDQEIYIRGVKDPMKILPDFGAEMPDFSDAGYWFEFETMDKAEYEEKYSESKLNEPSWADWGGMGQTIGITWIKKNQVTVAKYWYKETTIRHWAAFEDGTQGYLDEFGIEIDDEGNSKVVDPELAKDAPRMAADRSENNANHVAVDSLAETGSPPDEYPITEGMVPMERLAEVLKLREVVQTEVKWITTNGLEILDRGEWHTSEFPFVGVVGVDRVVDGKRDIHGIVRYAKDPQKMYNFLTSQIVRKIDASNKSAWIAAGESIPEPERKKWELSNKDNYAVLYYNAYTKDGKPLAPPSRGDAVEPAIQALLMGGQKFSQDIKSTVGIFEAGIGQGIGDRQSGDAIDSLAQRGENNNFHFSDNLVLSMKRMGCLILGLIPKVYDTARTIRWVGLDDQEDLVKINQMFTKNGQTKMHDIKSATSYDVVIDTGPTFATKKAEQADSMLKFAAVEPQLMPVLADLLVGNMDWDSAGTIKDRIQLFQSQTMPWLHAAQNGQMPNMDPKTRVMFQQLQQQNQQLQQAGQHVQQLYAQEKMKNDTNLIAHQAKTQQLQMKQVFELQKQRNALIAEQQNTRDKLVLERVKAELNHVNTRIDHTMQAMELSHNAQMEVAQTAANSVAATNTSPPPAALPAPAPSGPAQGPAMTPGLGGPAIGP